MRIIVGGLLVIAITLLIGNYDYNGAGTDMIARAIEGNVPAYAFLIKMLLTALTLAAGYKGGEIVPAFFTGATFGCLFGHIFGISPSLCAATGMLALFCGVTNCPIASMLIGFELFGFEGVSYILIAICFPAIMVCTKNRLLSTLNTIQSLLTACQGMKDLMDRIMNKNSELPQAKETPL